MEEVNSFCTAREIVLKRTAVLNPVPFSFSLPQKARVAVIGKNGAGKSTLLHAVLGEYYLASGEIYLGKDPVSTSRKSAREIAQTLSFVPQEHHFPSHFTGLELLRFSILSKNGIFSKFPEENDPAVLQVTRSIGIHSILDKTLSGMSSGERQKMFLASALIKEPETLLLDEPTNHLDPSAAHAFWKALEAFKGNILLSTHDLDFVSEFCTYVLALEKGSLYFAGTQEEFLQKEIAEKIFQI